MAYSLVIYLVTRHISLLNNNNNSLYFLYIMYIYIYLYLYITRGYLQTKSVDDGRSRA